MCRDKKPTLGLFCSPGLATRATTHASLGWCLLPCWGVSSRCSSLAAACLPPLLGCHAASRCSSAPAPCCASRRHGRVLRSSSPAAPGWSSMACWRLDYLISLPAMLGLPLRPCWRAEPLGSRTAACGLLLSPSRRNAEHTFSISIRVRMGVCLCAEIRNPHWACFAHLVSRPEQQHMLRLAGACCPAGASPHGAPRLLLPACPRCLAVTLPHGAPRLLRPAVPRGAMGASYGLPRLLLLAGLRWPAGALTT